MKSFVHIAHLVKSRRAANSGVSQRELSQALGYNDMGQFISNVERAKCSIPLENLNTLCAYLGITENEVTEALLNDYEEDILNHLKGNL